MLAPYTRDFAELQDELKSSDNLLARGSALTEKADILPLFRRCRHLAAFLGYANNNLVVPDKLGIELPLLGFQCDIAIGDSKTSQFTLVELEDASEKSIFDRRYPKRTFPQWSKRFEAGFSQLVDWAWRIDQERQPSVALHPIFGTTTPKIHYLLVIGRDRWLDDATSARLDWRRRHNGIQGQLTTIWTYDYFFDFVQRRLAVARSDMAT